MHSFVEKYDTVGTVRSTCQWVVRASLVLLAIIWLAPTADAGRLRQAMESRVAMELPESFTQSYREVGFADEPIGASFRILDVSGEGYERWKADALRPYREEKFIEPPQIRKLPGRTGEYQYTVNETNMASLSNEVMVRYDRRMVRYSFVFREGAFAAKIVAHVPKAGTVTQEQIERAFVSATIRKQAKEAFSLGYTGEFTRSPLDPPGLAFPKNYGIANRPAHNDTWFIVSVRKEGSPGPLPAFVTNWKIQSDQEIHVAGFKARERSATFTHWRYQTPFKAYLVDTIDKGRIYTMVGIASVEDMPKYLPEFKKMTASFQAAPAD